MVPIAAWKIYLNRPFLLSRVLTFVIFLKTRIQYDTFEMLDCCTLLRPLCQKLGKSTLKLHVDVSGLIQIRADFRVEQK